MAENFFTGLTGALQQNARQRNNDDYIELMRQKQLQSEMSGALADRRADEEMVLRREAAGRQQEESTRRIRALDFEQKQREDAAERINRAKTASANFATKFWGPEPVLDAAGNPVMDKDGNPVTTKRDPKNYRDQFKFFEGLAAISHEHNGIDPKAYGQFLMDRRALEEAGKTQVFENALRQDPDALTEVGAAIGLSGKVSIGTRINKFGIPSMFFTGTGKDGKPAEVDALTGMGIFGGNAKDPLAGARAQAVQTQTLSVAQQNADSNRISALRPSGGGRGGGGGGDDGDDSPLTGKALRKELTAFDGMLSRDKPEFTSSTVGAIVGPDMKERKVDDFKTDRVRELGIRALESGNARSAPEALAVGKQRYEAIEKEVLSGVWFVPAGKKNDSMGWRVAISPDRPAGAVSYNSDRVDPTLRIAGRNAAVTQRFKEISAREQKPQTAIKR